jgi:hypothetical protein
MQPGTPGPGQDPYQQNPYQPYPPADYSQPYSSPPAGEQYPTSPAEYSLYPPEPQYPQSPPAYPPTGYSVPPLAPPSSNNNVFGLLSMIFGIAAIPLMFCCYLGAPLGIAAIVLGIIGMQKANAGAAAGVPGPGKGMSIAGICCGGGAILLVIALFALGAGLSMIPSSTNY